jgi:hypothetical protein
VRRPASGSRRLGRLEKCICISCEAYVCETDGFTVELGVYRLADVDLGGLNGDKAYEPCPLLKTPLAKCLITKTLDDVKHTVLIGAMVKDIRRILVVRWQVALSQLHHDQVTWARCGPGYATRRAHVTRCKTVNNWITVFMLRSF